MRTNNLEQMKKKVNANKNRNTRFVRPKEVRTCKCCGSLIQKQQLCLTTNKKQQGRRWICLNCLQKKVVSNSYYNCDIYRSILGTKIEQNLLSFGDDGGWLACEDFISDLMINCENCPYDINCPISLAN